MDDEYRYEEWMYACILDTALEREVVDKITRVEPSDPAVGPPMYIYGFKDKQRVKYRVIDTIDDVIFIDISRRR